MSEHKFVRDNISSAVLNTDVNALEQYKLARDKKLQEQTTLQNCVNDINTLKNDMQEIKNLLLKISEK
jgi:surfactin synthase thioesterase subunit